MNAALLMTLLMISDLPPYFACYDTYAIALRKINLSFRPGYF